MRSLLLATAAATLGAALATPAFAQTDRGFTGPRVEALAGYDHVRDGSDGSSDGRDGLVYGGAIGYDTQTNGVVLGVEGEITGSTVKARTSGILVPADRLRVRAGRDLYIGGRIGYAVSPQALIYAKAGYTNARFNLRYFDGTTTFDDGRNMGGYRLGAGVEYKLTPTTYVKGEYRYSHYGHIDGISGVDPDLDRHQILAGVGIRF